MPCAFTGFRAWYIVLVHIGDEGPAGRMGGYHFVFGPFDHYDFPGTFFLVNDNLIDAYFLTYTFNGFVKILDAPGSGHLPAVFREYLLHILRQRDNRFVFRLLLDDVDMIPLDVVRRQTGIVGISLSGHASYDEDIPNLFFPGQ